MEYYVPPRPWYRPRIRVLLFWTLAAVALSTLYSYWSDSRVEAVRRQRELLAPPIGALCELELERETTGDVTVSRKLSGLFVSMNNQWVVLDGETGGSPQQWVPRERIVVLNVLGDSR